MPRNGMFADDGLVIDFARWVRNALTGNSTRMDGMDESISTLSSSVDTRFTDAASYADAKSAGALTAAMAYTDTEVADAKAYTDTETATKQDKATLDADVTALATDPTTGLYALLDPGPTSSMVLTYTDGWETAINPATVYREAGWAWMEGTIRRASGVSNSPFTIPAGYRPARQIQFPVFSTNGANADGPDMQISMDSTGVITIDRTIEASHTDETWVRLSSTPWRIGA